MERMFHLAITNIYRLLTTGPASCYNSSLERTIKICSLSPSDGAINPLNTPLLSPPCWDNSSQAGSELVLSITSLSDNILQRADYNQQKGQYWPEMAIKLAGWLCRAKWFSRRRYIQNINCACLVNSNLQNLSKRLNYVRSCIVFLNANKGGVGRGGGGEGGEVSGLVIIISSAD